MVQVVLHQNSRRQNAELAYPLLLLAEALIIIGHQRRHAFFKEVFGSKVALPPSIGRAFVCIAGDERAAHEERPRDEVHEERDDEPRAESVRDAFEQRAHLIEARLRKIPGLDFPSPEGAFYVFADVSAHFGRTTPAGTTIDSAMSFAGALLDEAKVAVVPGEDFGGCGDRCIRLSFACGEQQISEGCDRLAAFVSSLG